MSKLSWLLKILKHIGANKDDIIKISGFTKAHGKVVKIKLVKIMFNNHMGWLQKYTNMEFLSNI
jgi:hypothetical protein